jgi:hypothetical protein
LRRAVLILSCLIVLPAAARAETFRADYVGVGDGKVITVGLDAVTRSVWAGEILWKGLNGVQAQFADFYTYCADLNTYLVDPQTFEVKDANSFAPDGDQVAWLVGTYAPVIHPLAGTTANWMAAGLQLAIWNVLYDDDFTVSGTDGLWSDTAGAQGYANEYLGALSAALARGPLTAHAIWLDTNTGQDQVTVTVVPEPASILLLGIGTLAVLARRRRIDAA